MQNRDESVEAAAEEIENDFILLGATAIEDRLQDGVPEAIAKLAEAGIKLWVLTGDKMETAVSIGFSCNLLTPRMNVLTVKGGIAPSKTAAMTLDMRPDQVHDLEEEYVLEQIHACRKKIERNSLSSITETLQKPKSGYKPPPADRKFRTSIQSRREAGSLDIERKNSLMPESPTQRPSSIAVDNAPPKAADAEENASPRKSQDKNKPEPEALLDHALVIDGPALKIALEEKNRPILLDLACRCKAVICCRVSPLQKAKIVELVKHGKQVMTLAIGDGANDVSMIQASSSIRVNTT